jgi:hypothetical protein
MRIISTMGGHEKAPMPTMRRRILEEGEVTQRERAEDAARAAGAAATGALPGAPVAHDA